MYIAAAPPKKIKVGFFTERGNGLLPPPRGPKKFQVGFFTERGNELIPPPRGEEIV
jgi:hypothetical protein